MVFLKLLHMMLVKVKLRTGTEGGSKVVERSIDVSKGMDDEDVACRWGTGDVLQLTPQVLLSVSHSYNVNACQ